LYEREKSPRGSELHPRYEPVHRIFGEQEDERKLADGCNFLVVYEFIAVEIEVCGEA